MDKEEILKEIYNLSQEIQHEIMHELVNEVLCPVSRGDWKKITADNRCDKAIFNAIEKGKIKSIDIAGRKLPYVNWEY